MKHLEETPEDTNDDEHVETSTTAEPKKKRAKIALDLSKALLEMSEDSIEEVLAAVEENFEKTGTGLATPVLAEQLCGHKKYAAVISYLCDKYLADQVETQNGPSGGLLPKGKKPVAGASKNVLVDVSLETVEKVSETISRLLERRPAGVPLASVSIESSIPDIQIKSALNQLVGTFEFVPGVGIRYPKAKSATKN